MIAKAQRRIWTIRELISNPADVNDFKTRKKKTTLWSQPLIRIFTPSFPYSNIEVCFSFKLEGTYHKPMNCIVLTCFSTLSHYLQFCLHIILYLTNICSHEISLNQKICGFIPKIQSVVTWPTLPQNGIENFSRYCMDKQTNMGEYEVFRREELEAMKRAIPHIHLIIQHTWHIISKVSLIFPP